jgi:tRNA(Ile)-lysidine synthase
LRSYVAALGISVVQDNMNDDLRFDRSFLRHALWPPLQARWPAAAEVLARSAANVAQAQGWVEAAVHRDLDGCRDGDALAVPLLRRLAASRRLEVLRRFVEAAGVRPPPTVRLQEALRQMLLARVDKNPAIRWSDHALRRYRSRIYLTPARIQPLGGRLWNIHGSRVCELGEGRGRLVIRAAAGGFDPKKLPEVLHVRGRRGGDVLRLAAETPTRSVRHLFQDRGVVPWMRDVIPFVEFDGTLLAVADFWSESRFRCGRTQVGVAFDWEFAPPIL